MNYRKNAYEGKCRTCAQFVTEGAGWVSVERNASGRFEVYCDRHRPGGVESPAAVAAEPDPVELGVNWKGVKPSDAEPPAPVFAADELAKAVHRISELTAQYFVTFVPGMVAQEVEQLMPRELIIKVNAQPKVTFKHSHGMLPTVLQALTAGSSPFLVGPAGSGKTTLAEQCATALKLKFYMAARVTSEFKLTGFVNAMGVTVRTQFREAYEHGGVFLFDEVDASDPDALTSFNAALANGVGDFPDCMVKRHKDFYALAAGNTFGRGADRQYVGRNQLDAATLDRFEVFEVDYDEALELQLCADPAWAKYVQSVRKAIEIEKVRHIVSPRASIKGAKLLAAGMDRLQVESSCIWKGLPQDQRARVEQRMLTSGAVSWTDIARAAE